MTAAVALAFACAALAAACAYLYAARRRERRDADEIGRRLEKILRSGSAEKVLLRTERAELRRLLLQLNRLLDRGQRTAAEFSRSKESSRRMISNMSHDLKTPLAVLLGYTEKLRRGEELDAAERERTVEALQAKVLSLIDLMNRFFDLAKMDSDDYAMPKTKLALNELCRRNVLEFYELLESGGFEVELDIPDEPLHMLGNEEALGRILRNLISNAIRYGGEGKALGLTLRDRGETVEIEVWDRGRGIAEVHHDRVFERLYTLDDSRNPRFQGSGLGLSITKRLAEAMGGSISLRSVPYERTSFVVSFPKLSF
ncbi:ATP-binding protein [Paenibacillus sp. FSL W8-1187]|uniref:histidine kinase n=1 Tax=Paenibacillus pasadenensis TaxID=217090 RepID=A0A2N5N172_9BACL|nr:ATP-binding protein [Paenibacillus pasadenensis]PLT44079.1 Sensor histidine kinase [Paenibacillus pasadenensis]